MSYLHTPMLIFSGDFRADVSTVNNDITHYNNATFQSNFQQPGTGSQNGWWNPEGGSTFQFINCQVKKINMPGGIVLQQPAEDLILNQSVGGFDNMSPGKMADLDPQMQMCSQLWGVKFRIFSSTGESFLEADLLPSGFKDLQIRQYKGGKNGQPLGGSWTSVLYNLKWGKGSASSQVLKMLRSLTTGNKLSINLSNFGFYYAHADGRFALGRILGVIGPYYEGEPEMFAPARRLFGIYNISGDNNNPAVLFNYSNFIVKEDSKRINLDLGGSFPIIDPMGGIEDIWSLQLAVAINPVAANVDTNPYIIDPSNYSVIGELGSLSGDRWLSETGGIVSFPLSDQALQLIKNRQLLLLNKTKGGQNSVIAREALDGYVVRADNNILRLDRGEKKEGVIYVYQWGNPRPAVKVIQTLEKPAQTSFGGNPNVPFTGQPAEALLFPSYVFTDKSGKAAVIFSWTDPGNPRGYIDGQVYFVDYAIENVVNPDQYQYDQFVVHLRDDFSIPDQPGWADVEPIWKQFGNLYPIMSKYIVDLSMQEEVLKKKDILIFAFSREINDPVYMPATRDLSAAKVETLLKWLKNPFPGNDKKEKIPASKLLVEKELNIPVGIETTHSGTGKGRQMAESKSGSRIIQYDIDLPFSK